MIFEIHSERNKKGEDGMNVVLYAVDFVVLSTTVGTR